MEATILDSAGSTVSDNKHENHVRPNKGHDILQLHERLTQLFWHIYVIQSNNPSLQQLKLSYIQRAKAADTTKELKKLISFNT
jgi:hypothetical protein